MSPELFGIAASIVLLLVAGAVIALLLLFTQSNQQKQLRKRVAPTASTREEFADDTSSNPLIQRFARQGKAIEGWVDADNESARLLVQAGWRSNESRVLWYVFQAALPILMIALVFILWLIGPDQFRQALYLLMALFSAGALSFLMPRWILRSVAASRRQRIKNEVPLFIHLLVLLFEAGLSSRQAFASLVREGGGVLRELSREFELVLRQLEAGGDTPQVLKNLGDALQVEDLTNVLGILRQMDRYGGEVREPLVETLKVLEERRGLDMRERVNLLSGRMTAVMVLFFFPALLIFVAGPAFISIIRALGHING
jgi:tight adherence protein C